MPTSVVLREAFAPEAKALRAAFDARFRDPRKARADRFVWDLWHVPDQYTALRTPAWEFFPAPLYRRLHERLVRFGRETLGCHDISPPWLSCYVNGCGQELHGDLPHGPFAFVFSLTPWATRTFRGGETMLLKDGVLDYWSDFVSVRSVERDQLVRTIPAKWNRLIVFDPRVPHGVTPVTGSMDPREGRLVVHGWFVSPRPFVAGPLSRRGVEGLVERVTGALTPWLNAGLAPAGVLSASVEVGADGGVRGARWLMDTVRVPATDGRALARLRRDLLAAVRAHRFPRSTGPSRVTLPLVFERG